MHKKYVLKNRLSRDIFILHDGEAGKTEPNPVQAKHFEVFWFFQQLMTRYLYYRNASRDNNAYVKTRCG